MKAKSRIDPDPKTSLTHETVAYLIARGEPFDKIQPIWESYITDLAANGAKIETDQLVQNLVGQASMQTNTDLQGCVDKVKFYNETREGILEEITRLRTLRQNIDNGIANFEEMLAAAGDDAQLANVDLQDALQKQQQVLQMLSNISKLLNDTAMSVIRKIGG